jgi:hypothetical protein
VETGEEGFYEDTNGQLALERTDIIVQMWKEKYEKDFKDYITLQFQIFLH